jgi:hypothetical protein
MQFSQYLQYLFFSGLTVPTMSSSKRRLIPNGAQTGGPGPLDTSAMLVKRRRLSPYLYCSSIISPPASLPSLLSFETKRAFHTGQTLIHYHHTTVPCSIVTYTLQFIHFRQIQDCYINTNSKYAVLFCTSIEYCVRHQWAGKFPCVPQDSASVGDI